MKAAFIIAAWKRISLFYRNTLFYKRIFFVFTTVIRAAKIAQDAFTEFWMSEKDEQGLQNQAYEKTAEENALDDSVEEAKEVAESHRESENELENEDENEKKQGCKKRVRRKHYYDL